MTNVEENRFDVVPPPEHFELDFEEVGAWVAEEVDREHGRHLEDIRAEVALEQELNAPIIARARDLGLVLDQANIGAIDHFMQEKIERRKVELEELGVLRQSMPSRSRTACDFRTKPYHIEHEEDDGSSGSSSFADKVSGELVAKTSAHYDGSTNWARCSIGHWFTAKDYGGFGRCVIRDRGSATSLWGSFGVSSRLQMMLSLFLFNATSKSRWVKRRVVFSAAEGHPFVAGSPVTPAFVFGDGRHFGSFDPGDKMLVTVMMTVYAVAPLGFASIDYRGELLSLGLCHDVT